jgi:ankyrin repeat protein
MQACDEGDVELAARHLQEGALADCRDVDGYTGLMCACERGNEDMVQFLLEQVTLP